MDRSSWLSSIRTPSNKRPRDLELFSRASRKRHQDLCETRVGGVGDWLLGTKVFSSWCTSTVKNLPAKPVLFCYGDPGVGKTFISSLVIDTLCDEGPEFSEDFRGFEGYAAVAYMYCDFSAQNPQSTSSVLRSVLDQVIAAILSRGEDRNLTSAEKEIYIRKFRSAEILKLLIEAIHKLRWCFICIDALDEFPTKLRAQLWESLQRVVRECPSTRIFLTGRPQIRAEVGKYFPSDADMVSISPTSDDTTRYIERRLEEYLGPGEVGGELRSDILRVIPEMFSETFLLVALKMDAILGEVTIHKRRQTLGNMTDGLDLSNAYGKTLDRIRQQSGSEGKLGMEALMWISHCKRPLNSEELCHALGTELGQEDFHAHNVPSIWTVLGCTLGLLIVDETTSTVRLLHPTLHEYLDEHPTLFVTAHSTMAETCLTYLNSRSVRELPPSLDTALAIAPFLEYAACFWGTHAAVKVTEPLKPLALRLLDRYENHVSATILWKKKIREPSHAEHVEGISGLHCIAFWGIEEIAISMLEAKRWDTDCCDSEGDTPLRWAEKYGNGKLVQLLLKQGDIEPDVVRGGRASLSFAAQRGDEGVVKQLLGRKNINSNSSDRNDRTPRSYATMGWLKRVVGLLLGRGDVNSDPPDNKSQPPQPFAAGWGREDQVKPLPERGNTDPNSPDNKGRPPEHGSPDRGSPEVRGRTTAATPVQDSPGQETADPPPAPESVTSHATDGLPLDASNHRSTMSGPPQEPQPLPCKRPPPDQSSSTSAPSIPVPILNSNLALNLLLLALILLFIFTCMGVI